MKVLGLESKKCRKLNFFWIIIPKHQESSLFLVEPEGGDFAADGMDVASSDGAHDEQADEDGDADA